MDRTNIKEKLDAYRRQKHRQEMIQSFKNAMQHALPWNREKTIEEPLLVALPNNAEDFQDTESTCSDDSVDQTQCTMLQKITYLLYFILWATLYVIAIEFQFGAIYFILSMLTFIWLNTHTRPKKVGEPSAYSVFNPNCEAIEGTLDASQFEREIRYGIGSVR